MEVKVSETAKSLRPQYSPVTISGYDLRVQMVNASYIAFRRGRGYYNNT